MNAVKLAEAMRERDISITELSDKAKIEKSTISRILSGQISSCTVDTAGKIISVLELDPITAKQIFFED